MYNFFSFNLNFFQNKSPEFSFSATAALGKAKKKTAGKAAGSSEKIRLPVETDTNRLVNYVCGTNLLKEGGEDVKIGPDSDYPDWLFELYVGKLSIQSILKSFPIIVSIPLNLLEIVCCQCVTSLYRY